MKCSAALGFLFLLGGLSVAAPEPRVLAKVTPLPVALSDDFVEFLTLPAYERID